MSEKKEGRTPLTPGARKFLAWSMAGAAVLGIWAVLSSNHDRAGEAKPVEHVLTDASTKDLGMESLIAQIKIANDKLLNQEAEFKRMRKEVADARNELTANRSAKEETAQLRADLAGMKAQNEKDAQAMSKQIRELAQENERLKKLVDSAPTITAGQDQAQGQPQGQAGAGKQDLPGAPGSERYGAGQQGRQGQAQAPDATYIDAQGNVRHYSPAGGLQDPGMLQQSGQSFLDTPVNVRDPYELYANNIHQPPSLPDKSSGEGGEAQEGAVNSIVIASEPSEPEAKKTSRVISKPGKQDLYIPTGSMLRGVLLSGIYAPTGVNARKDPFPVVLRVQDEAVLPNLKKADLRECFLTLSGYGDMSSERALLRGETISCIANDNSVLEAKLPSYAVGEDGKAGVRGKLITRNGRALRNAMLSGFASGIGQAFQTTAVPQLDISGSSSTTYTTALSSNTLSNGLFNGASAALNRLADYYMDMAEQTFPVIEINAGREVTVTLTQGTVLKTIRDASGRTPAETSALAAADPAPAAGGASDEPRDNVPQPLNK